MAMATGSVALAICVGAPLGAARLAPGVAAAEPGQNTGSLLQRRPTLPLTAAMIPVTIVPVATSRFNPKLDHATAQGMVRDAIEDLLIEADAMKRLDSSMAATAAVDPLLKTIQTQVAIASHNGQVV